MRCDGIVWRESIVSDNLVLERLREIRDIQTAMREDIAEIKLRIGMVEAGYASLSLRQDRVAVSLERVERRLGLADAPH
jgi:hypothetical protein